MKDFWNQRFDEDSYAYGIVPNQFFKEQLDKLLVGSILLPAEGEGRNAVFAKSKGWDVLAFDYSESAMEKAMQLAKQRIVQIAYEVSDVLNFTTDNKFDVLELCYTHFPIAIRAQAHRHLLQFLKPKGLVIFEAFSKSQFGKLSGGPKNLDMFFSIDEINEEFAGLDFKFLKEETILLNEGQYHQGEASMTRFVASKN